MSSRSIASLLCRPGILALLLALGSTEAHAQTVKCDVWITSLPYVFDGPFGQRKTLCLANSVSWYAPGSGPAITLRNATGTTLDLTGHTILGSRTAPSVGIQCEACFNVVIRNGTVASFETGVSIDAVGSGVVVEDLDVDLPVRFGIQAQSSGAIVRNNRVGRVGLGYPPGFFDAILVTGPRSRVLNNDVTSMSNSTVAGGRDVGIHVSNAGDTIVEGNRITLKASANSTVGIMVEGTWQDGNHVLVADNRIMDAEWGIYIGGGLVVKYRDNLTVGVNYPFSYGTDAGNNN